MKIAVRVLVVLAGMVVLFAVAALVTNYIIMPLVVGHGEAVEIPNVVGMRTEDALALLREQGFEAAADEKRPDTLYEAGTVIEQRPSAGIKAKKGRRVQLVISSGEEMVRVPYLIDLTLEQAQTIAQRRGFEIEAVDTVQSDSIRAGRIVAMKPDPEIRVKPGTKLHLYISAGPVGKTIPMPNLIDLPLEKARALLEADSLILGEVKIYKIAGKGGIVLLQSPEVGVLVGPGDTIRLTIGQEP